MPRRSKRREPFRHLDIETKVMLIKEMEKRTKTKVALAKEYKTSTSTLRLMVRERHKIMENYICTTLSNKAKRRMPAAYEKLDKAVLEWMKSMRDEIVFPIKESRLAKKALELAKELNIKNFKASHTWIKRFRKRHLIHTNAPYGILDWVDETKNDEMDMEYNDQCEISDAEEIQETPLLSSDDDSDSNGALIENASNPDIQIMDSEQDYTEVCNRSRVDGEMPVVQSDYVSDHNFVANAHANPNIPLMNFCAGGDNIEQSQEMASVVSDLNFLSQIANGTDFCLIQGPFHPNIPIAQPMFIPQYVFYNPNPSEYCNPN